MTEHSIAKDVGAIHKDLAYLTMKWGELDTAERHARAAIEAAGAIGDRTQLPGAVTNLALVLMQKGYVDDARQEFQRAIHDFTALPNPATGVLALQLAVGARAGQQLGRAELLQRAHSVSIAAGLTLQQRDIETTIGEVRARSLSRGRHGARDCKRAESAIGALRDDA